MNNPTNIDTEFIPYETVKIMREKGFDSVCMGYYDGDKFRFGIYSDEYYQTPIYSQALDWLRHKYFMHITLIFDCSANEVLGIHGKINFMINEFQKPNIIVETDSFDDKEVLNQTILKALTLI